MGIYYSSVGTRLQNYLRFECLSVEDFAVLSPKFVRLIRNLGKKSEQAVRDRLEEMGLEPGKYEGQPGMPWHKVVPYYKEHKEEIRKENQIVYINKPEETEPQQPESVDWDSYRREVAKDILAGFASNSVIIDERPDSFEPDFYSKIAIEWADSLVKHLKNNETPNRKESHQGVYD